MMHAEAFDWVARSAARVGSPKRVMDQGGQNVNGSIVGLFPTAQEWFAVDMFGGLGVDVVADCGDYVHPEPCDVVVSTELLEHTTRGPDIVKRAFESLRSGGYYIITTAAPGRAPHGAHGDPLPASDEHYENVDPEALRGWLEEAGFVSIEIDRQGNPHPEDVRAFARKPYVAADIAVIVPVIGRPQNAAPFMASLQGSTVYAICEIKDAESIDAWSEAGAEIVMGDEHSFPEKVNLGYRSTEDTKEPWLLLVGDDVRFHEGWQDEALRVAEETGAQVIGTNDLMVPGVERAVHPLISREYIAEQGAGWDGPGVVAHEGYTHWFVDNEIRVAAGQRGVWAYAEKAVIEHLHFLNEKSADDDIYIAGRANAAHDEALFNERLAANSVRPVINDPGAVVPGVSSNFGANPVKRKIVVYGIAKDEYAHVERWATTALDEADEVVLVDTGSTDGTVEVAERLGVTVHRISVVPWRFDMARNAALSLLPADADVCLSLDMDEWLHPGWREPLEAAWVDGVGSAKVSLRFVTGEDKDADITLEYLIDRVHARQGSRWVNPCHEVAVCPGGAVVIVPGVMISHLPDAGKDRAERDMPLLRLGVQENPDDPRALYYLARQFFYANDWNSARPLFQQYLNMPSAVFDQERAEACRFVSRMVWPNQRERWLTRACYEAPQRRETWAELAVWLDQQEKTVQAAGMASRVLEITEKTDDNGFHREPFAWDDTIFETIVKKSVT